MTTQTSNSKKKASHRLSQNEMRASLLIPLGLGLGILFIAIVIGLVIPEYFAVASIIGIGLLLLGYLLWSTRKANWRLRILAILFAVPAIVGISLGLFYGSMLEAALGIGMTVVLLGLQRLFDTPLSYRAAYRQFRAGDINQALIFVNKSIDSRPDFAESYQLRALIHLSEMQFPLAERDAKKALALNPDAHSAYNTLGQIYLAQNRFAEAETVYYRAFELAPHSTLYLFHLGLSEYRQAKYGDAVESLTEATHGALPQISYDLQNYYYLVCSLEGSGNTEEAQTAESEMAQFQDGLRPLQRRLADQPEFPHLALLRVDLADLEKRLRKYASTSQSMPVK